VPEFALKEAFNSYFHHGCTTFTKHQVLAYGKGDRRRIEICLNDWESRNLLKILKPFETASDNEVIVKVLQKID
jgi:hypothetical protein